ncbi:MAG TPA: YetF domain-containing protein [Cytophagales bacterium]|nr:YetF domain-containing protein [Cytophagales bacterium]
MKEVFEWDRVLFNGLPPSFLLEVIFRSFAMFTVLLITLKFAGKRGVRQLSIFEMVIIISLGSAAGDPMFYEDVGIIPAMVVFVVVMALYRLVTWYTGKSKWFEYLIEGKTVCLIEEGRFSFTKFQKESLAQDEFFSELRVKSVEHLGQVRHAFIEPSGALSLFFYDDSDVRHGLPLIPKLYDKKSVHIPTPGLYSCAICGHTQMFETTHATCHICENDEWVASIKTLRRA